MSYLKSNSPLYSEFFSRDNFDTLQEDLQDAVEIQTGIRIERQNDRDLYNHMQSVFATNSFNPSGDIDKQVKWMNAVVVRKNVAQIVTGMRMYQRYIHDISNPIRPSVLPRYTSPYGNKIPVNTKIGYGSSNS